VYRSENVKLSKADKIAVSCKSFYCEKSVPITQFWFIASNQDDVSRLELTFYHLFNRQIVTL